MCQENVFVVSLLFDHLSPFLYQAAKERCDLKNVLLGKFSVVLNMTRGHKVPLFRLEPGSRPASCEPFDTVAPHEIIGIRVEQEDRGGN